MMHCKRYLFVYFAFVASIAFANQDDVRVLLRPPLTLFKYAETDRIKFFSEAVSRGNFGYFVHADEFHAWQFGVGVDFAIASFSDQAIWRLGSNLDGIADTGNDINFRMGQTHYEVFTALEYRILDSVLYAGYRHRCRHAADKSPARILRKTGPEIGYHGMYQLGPVDLQFATSANAYLFAYERPSEPRLCVSSTLQAQVPIWTDISLFAGAGLATTWVREFASPDSNLISDLKNATAQFSTGASVGIATKTGLLDLRTFLGYNRNFDNGFPNAKEQTHLVSANVELWL